MPGQIKSMIDDIIARRSRGISVLQVTTKAKIMLKGIDPDCFDRESVDDPRVIARLEVIARDFGIDPQSIRRE